MGARTIQGIVAKTFNGQEQSFEAKDIALSHSLFFANKYDANCYFDGYKENCAASKMSASQILIREGLLMIQGRIIEIVGNSTVVTVAGDGYITIKLEPNHLQQEFVSLNFVATLAGLRKDDIYNDNFLVPQDLVFEIPLYQISSGVISEIMVGALSFANWEGRINEANNIANGATNIANDAVAIAEEAKRIAEEASSAVGEAQGTVVSVAGIAQAAWDADTKADLISPNFRSDDLFSNLDWADMPILSVIKGTGWVDSEFGYFHNQDNAAPLSFEFSLQQNSFLKVTFNVATDALTGPFDIYLSNSATGKDKYIALGMTSISKVWTFDINENYNFMNIFPAQLDMGNIAPIVVGKLTGQQVAVMTLNNVPIFANDANLFVGGSATTIGVGNTSFGVDSLSKNITGNDNVAIGFGCLTNSISGYSNIGIGSHSLANITFGYGNIGIGNNSGNGNDSGNHNIAIGSDALYSNTNSSNIAIGNNAFFGKILGASNIAIGNNAGNLNSDNSINERSDFSVFIGADTKTSGGVVSGYETVIGAGAVGHGTNTITLGNANVGALFCKQTVITGLSDSRIKENVKSADLNLCYDAVKNLPVTRYKYKDFVGNYQDKNVTGFLADDVAKVFPKSVTETDTFFEEDGESFLMEKVKAITMTEAVPTLWGSVQFLMKKVEELEKKLGGK